MIVSVNGHLSKRARQDDTTNTGTQYDNSTQESQPVTNGRNSDVDEDPRRIIRKEKKKRRRNKLKPVNPDSMSESQLVPKEARSSNTATQPEVQRKPESEENDLSSAVEKIVLASSQLEASAAALSNNRDTKDMVDMFAEPSKFHRRSEHSRKEHEKVMNTPSIEPIAKSANQEAQESVTDQTHPTSQSATNGAKSQEATTDRANAITKRKRSGVKRKKKSTSRKRSKQGSVENSETQDASHLGFPAPMI